MTLKEKLEVEIMDLPIMGEVVEDIAKNLEYVVEDFAIGFALWKETIEQDDNGMYYNESRAHVSRKNPVNIKQLLEIYKKEREL